jgi:ketosteroid isomerase-like protein
MDGGILQATAALVSALVRGDVAAAGVVYSDDARLLAPAGDLIRGRAAVEAYWRAGVALGLSAVEFESLVTVPTGARVTEVGRYAMAVDIRRSHSVVEHGTYLVVHRRVDSAWRRDLDVFEPDEPNGARHDPKGDRDEQGA